MTPRGAAPYRRSGVMGAQCTAVPQRLVALRGSPTATSRRDPHTSAREFSLRVPFTWSFANPAPSCSRTRPIYAQFSDFDAGKRLGMAHFFAAFFLRPPRPLAFAARFASDRVTLPSSLRSAARTCRSSQRGVVCGLCGIVLDTHTHLQIASLRL